MAAEEGEVETSVTSSGGWEAIGTGAPPSPRSSSVDDNYPGPRRTLFFDMAAGEGEVETSTSSGGWEAIGTGAPPSPRSSVDTCTLVDRYTELKLLGEPDSAGGGVQQRALVFSAKKVEVTTVCLKVLLDYTSGGDRLLLHNLHRERKALSEAWAAHPNILRIHDKFTAQPHPALQGHLHSPVPWDALRSKANAVVYTEVEPISGSLEGLVAARRRSGSITPIIGTDELTALLSGGLQALQHLHRNKISHRDIRPDNMLVCGDPIVDLKLSDFGCCFAAADHGGTWSIPVCDRSPDGGGLGGALESLAPEVRCHIGQPHAIVTFEKNDVWAFGRALHVAACPGPGMEPYGDGQFISNETFREPPLGYIDSLSGKLLGQMLQVQAEERLPVDVAGLHAYKRDADPNKRIAAHTALSLTVAAESRFEPLVEFLNDSEAEVRREGMLALPRLYPLTSPARMATAVQHFTDPAPQMRRAAAAVLLHALKAQTVGGATTSSLCMTEEQWEELFEHASNGVESELQQQKQREWAAAEWAAAEALAQPLETAWRNEETLAEQLEEAVRQRDEALAQREKAIRQKDEALAQQLLTERQKDDALEQRDDAVRQKDDALAQKLEAVRQRDEALAHQQESFAQQEEAVLEAVRGRDEALAKQEEAVRQRDEALAQQLLADRQKDEAVAQLQETVHQKDDALAQKLEAVRQRDEALAQQQESFAQQEEAVLEAVRGRDEALAKQEQAVRERDEAGAQREEAVRQREEALAQQRMTDRQKHDAVARLQQAVRQKDELAQKLEAVRQRDEALAQQQDAVRQLEAARQKNGMGRTIENMQLHDAVVKAGIHLQAMEERVIGVAKSSE